MKKRAVGIVSAVALIVGGIAAIAPWPVAMATADAANWNPGYIISDEQFYNSTSLTASQIQTFLNDKGKSCVAGTGPCLKDYKETTTNWAADSYCKGYTGAASESAATIIAKVSVACGINPKVLLVTLQKENSLVTRTKPTSGSYQTAMGFGCPDGAACNTAYYGFYNQVYRAARQFKVYAANVSSFSFKAGAVNSIRYSPNAACGATSVFIQNQATASLYIYTPYQPNPAALANLYGTGDGCSSYGNRNFWIFYTDWFGDPRASLTPLPTVIALPTPVAAVVKPGTTGLNVRTTPSTSGTRITGLDGGAPLTITGYTADGWLRTSVDGTSVAYVSAQYVVVPVVSISAAAPTATLATGATAKMAYSVYPPCATNQAVTWTSSSITATVDAAGQVTGVSPGHATVTATTQDGGFTAATDYTITGPGDPVVPTTTSPTTPASTTPTTPSTTPTSPSSTTPSSTPTSTSPTVPPTSATTTAPPTTAKPTTTTTTTPPTTATTPPTSAPPTSATTTPPTSAPPTSKTPTTTTTTPPTSAPPTSTTTTTPPTTPSTSTSTTPAGPAAPVAEDYVLAPTAAVYDGNPQAVEVTPAEGVDGLGDATVYYAGTGATVYDRSTMPPTAAGTYDVSVDVAVGTKHAEVAGLSLGTLTIAKADPTYVLPTPSATYGDLLASVKLPMGWTWEDAGRVGKPGASQIKATYTPADPANYNVLNSIEVTVQVAKRAITVKADNHSKMYGAPDPALTYTVKPALLAGDKLTGSLMCAGSEVGTYDIVQATPFSSPNYDVTFVKGTMTIRQNTVAQDVLAQIQALPAQVSTPADADAVTAATKALDAMPGLLRVDVPQSVLDALAAAQAQAGVVNHATSLGTAAGASLPWNVRAAMRQVAASDPRAVTFTRALGDGVKLAMLYDIAFTDTLTGSAWQPPAGSTVTINLTGVALTNQTGLAMAHQSADGTVTTVGATISGTTLTFTGTSFSLYGIVTKPVAASSMTPSGQASSSILEIGPMARGAGIALVLIGGVGLAAVLIRRRAEDDAE